MAAEIEVELEDGVSKPAKTASKSLDKLSKSAKGVKNNAGKIGGSAQKVKGLGSAADASAAGMKTLAGAAKFAATAVAAVAVAAGAAFASALGQSLKFADGIRFSLTAFLKSGPKAEAAIARIMGISNELGVSFQTAASTFKSFISAGLGEDAAANMIKFRADVQAFAGDTPAAVARVENAFVQLEKAVATGKIEADGFNSIVGNLPVNQVQIMTELAKKMKVPLSDLVDSSGKLKVALTELPVDKLVESIQDATLKATGFGKAGDAAFAKATSTVSGLVGMIKNRAGNAIDQLALKIGPNLGKAALPVLDKLASAMNSPEFSAGLSSAADFMSGAFVTGIDVLTTAFNFLKPIVSGFFDGFGTSAGLAVPVIKKIGSALMSLMGNETFINGVATAFKVLGFAMGIALDISLALIGFMAAGWAILGAGIGIIGAVGNAIVSFFSAFFSIASSVISAVIGFFDLLINGSFSDIQSAVSKMSNTVTGFFSTMGAKIITALVSLVSKVASVGGEMMAGLVGGIKGAAGAVVGAITGVVGNAISSAKALLGIASPSKVFEEFGVNTVVGFERGVVDEGPRVSSALGGVLDPSSLAALGPGGGTNNLSASSNATINVQGATEPANVAMQVRDVLLDELLGTFEQLRIEVSGA